MSQAGENNTAALPVPPTVPTSFQGQNTVPGSGPVNDGISVPVANVINFNATSVQTNNDNGIQAAFSGQTGTYEITNRIIGTATTSDGGGQTQQLYSFPLGTTPGTYLFFTRVAAFDSTNPLAYLGASYSSFRAVRTDGVATATLIGASAGFVEEEGDMVNSNLVNSLSGNNAVLTATGIAGKTIKWKAITEYVFTG